MPSTCSTVIPGSSSAVSRVPGAPPSTATEAMLGRSKQGDRDAGRGGRILGIAHENATNIGDEIAHGGHSLPTSRFDQARMLRRFGIALRPAGNLPLAGASCRHYDLVMRAPWPGSGHPGHRGGIATPASRPAKRPVVVKTTIGDLA
jgi:hypothetical protein